MAEYYAVLKRAVSGLDPASIESRRAVYDKARNALIGQLKAIDPPLPTSEISRQRLDLEEAIRKVERESASGASPAAAPSASAPATGSLMSRPQAASSVGRSTAATPMARPPTPPRTPAPAARVSVPVPAQQMAVEPPRTPEPVAGPDPDADLEAEAASEEATRQDVFRRAIRDAEARGAAAGAASHPPPAVRAESTSVREMVPELRSPRSRPLPPDEPAPSREADYDEPRLAPEYDRDWDEPPQRPQGASQAPYVDERDRPPASGRRSSRRYVEDDDRAAMERQARPSRLPSILLTILILAMLGGLGALAWSQRTILGDLLDSFKSTTTAESTPPAQVTPEAPPAPPSKDTDRLLPGAPAGNVRVVGEAPGASTDQGATVAPDSTPTAPATAQNDSTAQSAPAAPVASTTTDTSADDSLVAQKAILYEEPLDGAGAGGVAAINGAVTWKFVPSGTNGPEIQANIDVPDRNMKIRMSIRRNVDSTLPASHLIEIVVDTPADFPGKGIRSVPRIVMKPTEEARGQPLIGASAKVADGFFWIALSSIDADVTSNLGLLRERDWIDLPFVYETGQRAIVTFEKGTPGQRVFEKALAAWGS
jgi:hypothetical protein